MTTSSFKSLYFLKFIQLNARPKNFLWGYFLVLRIKDGPVTVEDDNLFSLLGKTEIFSPAIFNILKEPKLLQKQTIPKKKALNLSF